MAMGGGVPTRAKSCMTMQELKPCHNRGPLLMAVAWASPDAKSDDFVG